MAACLIGASQYVHLRISDNRSLHLFGNIHNRTQKTTDGIHLVDYLSAVIRTHPNVEYALFIEVYTTTPQDTILQQTGTIDRVYNGIKAQKLPNLRVIPADIRVRGLHTEMTRFLKAYAFARYFSSVFDSTPERIEQGRRRFLETMGRLNLDFDRLWTKFGFTDPGLYTFFKQEFSENTIRPAEKQRYMNLIDHITSPRDCQTRAYKSMQAHLLIIGSLFVDLHVCGKILQTPPHSVSIALFGTDHIHRISRFFGHTQTIHDTPCIPIHTLDMA